MIEIDIANAVKIQKFGTKNCTSELDAHLAAPFDGAGRTRGTFDTFSAELLVE